MVKKARSKKRAEKEGNNRDRNVRVKETRRLDDNGDDLNEDEPDGKDDTKERKKKKARIQIEADHDMKIQSVGIGVRGAVHRETRIMGKQRNLKEMWQLNDVKKVKTETDG